MLHAPTSHIPTPPNPLHHLHPPPYAMTCKLPQWRRGTAACRRGAQPLHEMPPQHRRGAGITQKSSQSVCHAFPASHLPLPSNLHLPPFPPMRLLLPAPLTSLICNYPPPPHRQPAITLLSAAHRRATAPGGVDAGNTCGSARRGRGVPDRRW